MFLLIANAEEKNLTDSMIGADSFFEVGPSVSAKPNRGKSACNPKINPKCFPVIIHCTGVTCGSTSQYTDFNIFVLHRLGALAGERALRTQPLDITPNFGNANRLKP